MVHHTMIHFEIFTHLFYTFVFCTCLSQYITIRGFLSQKKEQQQLTRNGVGIGCKWWISCVPENGRPEISALGVFVLLPRKKGHSIF